MLNGKRQLEGKFPSDGLTTLEALLGLPRQPGRHYFAEPAAGGDPGGDPAGDPGAAGAPAAVDDPPVGGDPPAGDSVSVLRSNFAHLADDGDINKVIHLANEGQKYGKDGWPDLMKWSEDNGVDAYLLMHMLQNEGGGDPSGQPGQPGQPAQPASQPAQPGDPAQPASQPGEPAEQPLTKADVQSMLEEERQTFRTQQDFNAAVKIEQDAYPVALKGLGYEPKPIKVNVEGKEEEMDPFYELIFKPVLMHATNWLHNRSLNPNDPQYQQKLSSPVPPSVVNRAAALIAPFLKNIGENQLEDLADSQEGIPAATNAGGPAARPSKRPEDMTPEERKANAFASARKRGAIMSEKDRNEASGL